MKFFEVFIKADYTEMCKGYISGDADGEYWDNTEGWQDIECPVRVMSGVYKNMDEIKERLLVNFPNVDLSIFEVAVFENPKYLHF